MDRHDHAGGAYLWYSQGLSLKADETAQRQVDELEPIIMRNFLYRLDVSASVTDPKLQIESDILRRAMENGLKSLQGRWPLLASVPGAARRRAALVVSVSEIRADQEPKLVRKASKVANYTQADGERHSPCIAGGKRQEPGPGV